MNVPPEDKQVVAHLYRGEMNRMTVYRQRLDTTTNWAITLESAILVVYTDKRIELYFIFFPLLILLFLSFLEARRYRYFYTSAKRVQYLETGYFVRQILRKDATTTATPNEDMFLLAHNLANTDFLIGLGQAWVVRFYRNYIWLCYISILIMTYKCATLDDRAPHNIATLVALYAVFGATHASLHRLYTRQLFIDF